MTEMQEIICIVRFGGVAVVRNIALALHKIKGGIDHEIVDAVITLIELYRKAGEL